jgi:hypothetical protein
MGLTQLLQRWMKGEDARAIEKAKEESRMTSHERDVEAEDFEAQKEDIAATRGLAGSSPEDLDR